MRSASFGPTCPPGTSAGRAGAPGWRVQFPGGLHPIVANGLGPVPEQCPTVASPVRFRERAERLPVTEAKFLRADPERKPGRFHFELQIEASSG